MPDNMQDLMLQNIPRTGVTTERYPSIRYGMQVLGHHLCLDGEVISLELEQPGQLNFMFAALTIAATTHFTLTLKFAISSPVPANCTGTVDQALA